MKYICIVILALFFIGCSKETSPSFHPSAYQNDFKNGDIIIVKFGAEWCGPCHTLDKIIDNSDKIQQFFDNNTKGYYKIDIDSKDPIDKKWIEKANPTTIPLVVKYIYSENKWTESKRFVGVRQEKEILNWLK